MKIKKSKGIENGRGSAILDQVTRDGLLIMIRFIYTLI